MSYREIDGDVVKLALQGEFDVVVHGCNCLCTMGAGVAVPMKNAFQCDKFTMERSDFKGDINKLGTIDYEGFYLKDGKANRGRHTVRMEGYDLFVVNAYTQYRYGRNHADGDAKPFDYDAFNLCMKKINHIFKGKTIGMPKIGSHLAGGDWSVIKSSIIVLMKDVNVVVVNFKQGT